jgi:hypothetical protein
MRWTQAALLTTAPPCGRRSRVVLTPRRWRQVGESNFTDDGGKQARSPGRARNKRLKPSRAGMPGDPGATVVTNACAFYHCARGCGCNGHPAFPTASLGGSFLHNSGATRRGDVKACVVSADASSSQPSSPAKAGDPVFRDAYVGIEKLRRTGYSAFAEYDDFIEDRPSEIGRATIRNDAWKPHLTATQSTPAHGRWRLLRRAACGRRRP